MIMTAGMLLNGAWLLMFSSTIHCCACCPTLHAAGNALVIAICMLNKLLIAGLHQEHYERQAQ